MLPLFLGFPEILLIVLIVLLLFGGRKIPELMKGMGKGVRNFKEGMKEGDEPEEPGKASPKQAADKAAKKEQ